MDPITIKLEITPLSSPSICGEIIVVTDSDGKPAINSVLYGGSVKPVHGSTIRFESAQAFLFVPHDPAYWRLKGDKHGALWKDCSDNWCVAIQSTKESPENSNKNFLELTIKVDDPVPPFTGGIYQSIYQILGLFACTSSCGLKETKESPTLGKQTLANLPKPPPAGTSGINVSDDGIPGRSKDAGKTGV